MRAIIRCRMRLVAIDEHPPSALRKYRFAPDDLPLEADWQFIQGTPLGWYELLTDDLIVKEEWKVGMVFYFDVVAAQVFPDVKADPEIHGMGKDTGE